MNMILVAIGGAIGSTARYVVDGAVYRLLPATFPYGTFVVNVTAAVRISPLRRLDAAAVRVQFHIIYVSANAVVPSRSRTRAAIAVIRHVFLEEDHDGEGLLRQRGMHPDIPLCSYIIHSSPLDRPRRERLVVDTLQPDLGFVCDRYKP